MKSQIVYEDNNLIICRKPAGMPSQSDKTFDVDLLGEVKNYRILKKEKPEVYIINRLDKPVSGLVLLAKNNKTAKALSALSGEHSIEKYYYAVVKGHLEAKGEFTDYLLKDARNNHSSVVSKDTKDAKKASLGFETLEERVVDEQVYSLVRIRLFTGRHHQIRVQFSHHGHPLYGDIKYNPDFAGKKGVFPALFAYHLAFNNPVGADRICVEVGPGDFIGEFEYFNHK